MNHTLPTRSLVASIVVASLVALLIGCDEGPSQPPDTEPSFGTERVQNQAFTVGMAIAPLALPAATGGNAPLTYSLTPNVPGIRFDAATRTVAGTPTAAGDHAMTYLVTDADDDADSLSFTITIAPDTDVAPEVHILSKSLLENDVLTVADDSLSFSQPVSYRQGDFIAGEISAKTPYGLLRKVTSVSADSRSVMTADATLEDAIERGTVRISGTLTPDDLTPASRAALAEVGLVATQDTGGLTPATTGEVRFGNELSATDGSSTLGGRIDFVLGYELIADYDRGLKDARFSVTPRQVVTVRLSTAGAFRKTWQIGPTLRFSPLPVPGAPFPVVFTPELELHAGVGGGLAASVSATHTESVTVGVECDDECGDTESWSSIYESHQPAASGVSFETEAAGTIGVFVAPKLTFNLYGRLGGPYVSAISSIDANAASTNAGSGQQCLHLSLQAALRGEVGGEARVSVFGTTLFSARLGEFAFDIVDPVVLWEEQGPCEEEPPADTEPSFGAERVEDQAYAVGTAITALVLPAASGGDAPLTYSLRPDIPGLQFNARTRALSGTPTLAAAGGVYSMTYRVMDSDGDEATLTFTVRVTASEEETKPAAELTKAITFTGGTVRDGRPPAPTNQPGDPQLSGAPPTASTIAPGDEGSMSIDFSNVPANTPFDVNIRFAGADQFINIPIDPTVTGGNTSGTLDLPFSLPASVCDDLGDIQHQIACYESVSVGGVNVSLEQARQIVLDCGRQQYCDSAGANLAGKDLRNLNLQDCTFAGANLRGADLSGANLRGADLSDADLSRARFPGADLSNANLSGATLVYADLSDDGESGVAAANLTGTDLSNANLNNAYLMGVDLTTVPNLSGVTMRFADLHRANLAAVNLSGADLGHADFPGADLSNANLSGATLVYADLSGDSESGLAAANLTGTDLSNANLNNAYLMGVDLTTVPNLSGVTMRFADLHRANLAAVNLSGADLGHADFPGADLSNANLSGATLVYADLSDDGESGLAAANLTGTDLSNANLNNAYLMGVDLTTVSNLSGVTMRFADLHRANLAAVNLSGADLGHADFPGADLSNANLSGATLVYADLSGDSESGLAAANLTGTDLSNANLNNADLTSVDLSTANLSGVRGCPSYIPIGHEDRFDDCG